MAVDVQLKTITLVHNVTTDPDNQYRDRVKGILESYGAVVHWVAVHNRDYPVIPPGAEHSDMAIVIGGDGTVLRTARVFSEKKVPIVAVNRGSLGFLTRIDVERLEESLKRLMTGQYTLESRTMLSMKPNGHNGNYTKDSESLMLDGKSFLAINDVLIKNTNPSQMATIKVYINGTPIAVYDADGVIVATPTGSTAYTLSAGGPVVSPEVTALIITPICPHSLSAKPIVVPENAEVVVESLSQYTDLVIAVDGQERGRLENTQSICITRAPFPMHFVRFEAEEEDFYSLLRKKLHWSMNPRWKSDSEPDKS